MNEKHRQFTEKLGNKYGKIELTDAAINGIQGTTEVQMNNSEEYKKLVEEADQRIAENRHRETRAVRKAEEFIVTER